MSARAMSSASGAGGPCSLRGRVLLAGADSGPRLHWPHRPPFTSAASRAPARPSRGRRRRSAARCWREGSIARRRALLQGLDQHPSVGEAADAHASDQAVVGRIADVVVEHDPVVEQRAERMPADLHCDRLGLGVDRGVDLVERPLSLGVEMGDRAGADVADQRRPGSERLAAAADAAAAARCRDTRPRRRSRRRAGADGRSGDRSRRKANVRAPWPARCGFCRCA